ncbi:TRAP transporter large permease subunit, partial [Salmonella enterica subsp. enterica serovar Kentucky]|nr:TRAP transporter large permease subunit [Salmonella enterica subsp. enterica serovar Kentucky]
GKLPGSLSYTNIVGNMMFGAISGSAIAASTSIGGVMVPMSARGWLLATQLLLLAAIAAMGFLEPGTQLRWMAALAVVIAFCSA